MRRNAFLLRFMLIGIVMHAYVGLRLVPALATGTVSQVIAVLLLVLSCLLIPAAMFSRRMVQPMPEPVVVAGLVAMGFFSSLLTLTVLRDVLLLCLAIYATIRAPIISLDAWRSWSAAAVPSLSLLFTVAGFINARRLARVVSVDVPIDGLPESLVGFTIAQISDVHVGPTIKHDYLGAIVNAVNQLKPDMIAVTGDMVDGSVQQLSRHTSPLAQLSARHGTFLVTGNHEYYSGAPAWIAEFRRLGMHVLLNEHVMLDHGGTPLLVAGVTDLTAGHYDASQRSDPAAALVGAPPGTHVKVLLAHQPGSAFAAARENFTLQLSG
ncbi:MAG: metallophosphoesterase, partial [Janthinobacterium lividum]